MSMSIGEVAGRVGLDVDTLRWFERHGVLPRAARDTSGRRRYDEAAAHLIEVLMHLRRTGMPLRRIAEFTELASRDPAGVEERLALLIAHRDEVLARRAALDASLVVIEGKIRDYAARVDDRT